MAGPRVMRDRKPAFSAAASAARQPTRTSTPAARSAANPWPFTRGSGSSIGATTRATPAAASASAQGGVWPVCAQGSSVT